MKKVQIFTWMLAAGMLLATTGCGHNANVPVETEAIVAETSADAEVVQVEEDTAVTDSAATDMNDSVDTEAAAAPESAEAPKLPAFTTVDLDGNEVTEAVFADKDLTVINIWGTFCGPCINEMPELGKWAKELPDNVQIVGLICDIADLSDTEHVELANEITEKAGADFLQLVGDIEDLYPLMREVTGVPTTIFVDSEGRVVEHAIVGAYVDQYKEVVNHYLENM